MSATTETKVGVKPDKWLKHRSIYSESLMNLQEATSENQSKLKAAKADGIHIDAMKMVSRLNRKDPAEAAVFVRAVLEGALVERCSFMFQGDMLNGGSIADLFKVPDPSDRAVAQFKESEALEIGYNRGLNNGSEDDLKAMFEAGSSALVQALRGFKRGRAFMESTSVPGIVKVAASRGRRGGRANNGAEEVAPTPRKRGRGAAAAEDVDTEFEAETDEDEEQTFAPPSDEAIDLEQVRTLSVHKGALLWNRLTGERVKKFENKGVMLQKFERLAAARSEGGSDAQAA